MFEHYFCVDILLFEHESSNGDHQNKHHTKQKCCTITQNLSKNETDIIRVCHIVKDSNTYRLILSQSFHKLKNIVKFYMEFILCIIERIKLKISQVCHCCDQKREVNVILKYNTRLHVILFSAFSWKTHQSYAVYQNDINFSCLITKVTNWWNFQFDSFHNTKHKFLVKLHYVF